MPTIKGALDPEGALVSVRVGLSWPSAQALRAALRSVPAPVTTQGVLDTGAEMTCIDSSVVQTLNLAFGGTLLANLPGHGGLTLASLHDASLTIIHPAGDPRDNLVIHNLTVLDIAISSLGYQVLIGRDVLARCDFLYSGLRNKYRLSY